MVSRFTRNLKALKSHMSQFTHNRLGLETIEYIDPIKVYDIIKKQLGKKHYPLLEFEHKAWIKWYGSQGGYPSQKQLDEAVMSYYGYEPGELKEFKEGINYLIDELSELGYREFSVQPEPPHVSLTKSAKNSNSGIYLFGKRNDPQVMAISYDLYLRNPYNFQPIYAMTRYAKNKLRIIFNDDVINYIREARYVNHLYEIFKRVNGTSMLNGRFKFQNNIAIQNLITPNTVVLEGDAEAMDTTVTLKQVQSYVEPILFHLYPERYHDDIRRFHIDLFSTTLVLPTGKVLTGFHSLFSGILPTNIYESIIMLVGHRGAMLVSYWITGQCVNNYAHIEVIGDDILILFNSLPSEIVNMVKHDSQAKVIYYDDRLLSLGEWQVLVLEQLGLKAKLEKQRVAVGSAFFCKRYFSSHLETINLDYNLQGMHSARSMILTVNSINNPEYGNDTGTDEFLRIIGILDDGYGHPLWNQVTDAIFSAMRKKFDVNLTVTQTQLVRYNKKRFKNFDWVLEGVTWTLENSPAYQRWTGNYEFKTPNQYLSF